MVDIHAHIMPGVDDGPKLLSEALQMVESAAEEGTDTMIVTPHSNVGDFYENCYDEEMEERFLALELAVKEQGLSVTLLPGMEVFGTAEVPELLTQGKLITLNHSRYLLIEFGYDMDYELSEYLLRELLQLKLCPVIAHPERYPLIREYPEIINQWVEMGCVLQVNKGSILGSFGYHTKEMALSLLRQSLVSFVASDAHGLQRRSPGLSEVYRFLCRNFSSGYAKLLMNENPQRVVKDMELIHPQTRISAV